jgi:Dihaem cytochrome c
MQITEQPWFVREHGFSLQVWQRPEVRTKRNCPACHTRADEGI